MRHAIGPLAVLLLLATPPAIAAAPRVAPATGEFGGELTDPETNAPYMRYVARVPKKILSATTRAGLIVLLHGIGGRERNLMGSLTQALAEDKSPRIRAFAAAP